MNEVLEKLKTPGLGLVITGALNLAIGFGALVSGLMRLAGVIPESQLPRDEYERLGFIIGTVGSYGICFLSMVIGPLVILGGTRLMNGRSPGLIRTASILAILPFTSCCFPAGAVFGIWALVVLSKPEVKAYMAGNRGI